MTDDEDFSEAPVTIGEVRAHRSRSSGDWTPRDLLVRLLREIDSGELDMRSVVVVYDTERGPGMITAQCEVYQGVGLLEVAKMEIVDECLSRRDDGDDDGGDAG